MYTQFSGGRIVADTNIWYRIGEKLIDVEIVKRIPVAVSALTILEILSSPNLLFDAGRSKVTSALKAIKDTNAMILRYYPYEFAAREYLGKKIKRKFKISHFHQICSEGLEHLDVQAQVNARKQRVDDFRSDVGVQSAKVKSDINLLNSMLSAKGAIEIVTNDFIHEIGKVLNVNARKVNMKRIMDKGTAMNLYLHSRARYFQTLTKLQPAGNDQIDLTNLLYVRGQDLYWTFDEKWIRIIIETGYKSKLFANEINSRSVIDKIKSQIKIP